MMTVDNHDSLPTVVDAAFLLDDLDLLRSGVPLLEDVDAPVSVATETTGSPVRILDPEGVPIAVLDCAGEGSSWGRTVTRVRTWLSRRPERPFEAYHLGVDATPLPDHTLVLDERLDASMVEHAVKQNDPSSVLILVPVSLERDGQTESCMVDRVRQVREMLATVVLPHGRVTPVIVPISDDHPHRDARIRACAAAYARGGLVTDLTATVEGSAHVAGSGAVVFFTGLSGSGKSTLAKALRNRLLEQTDRTVTLLDGDVVRRHLSAGLGFGVQDRETNIRRIGWVAARIAEHGGLAICSPIAPFERTRLAVQKTTQQAGGKFVLIHVATPLGECERRDRKGLYARARRHEIPDFTGISSPYEEPRAPDLRINTTGEDVEVLVQRILDFGVYRELWDRPLDSGG